MSDDQIARYGTPLEPLSWAWANHPEGKVLPPYTLSAWSNTRRLREAGWYYLGKRGRHKKWRDPVTRLWQTFERACIVERLRA